MTQIAVPFRLAPGSIITRCFAGTRPVFVCLFSGVRKIFVVVQTHHSHNVILGVKQNLLKMVKLRWHAVLGSLGAAAIGAAAWSLSVPSSDWKIAGPFGGSATTVAVDAESPKTVLAGGMDSLLYESQDNGANWALLAGFPRRNLGEVTSILIDPSNSNHYLVGDLDAFGGGLFESFDGGKTWSVQSDFKNVGVRALAASQSTPSEFVAGTTSKGVFLSADSGKTWKQISDPSNLEMQGISALAVDPKNADVIYAGTSHLPWRTTDGGKTWESIHSGMIDDSDVFSIYVDPKTPSDVFASACSGIYSSLNSGDSWKKIAGIPNTSRRTHVIRESPDHPGMIFAGTTTGLFRSPNEGTTWKVLTSTPVNALAFDPSQPNAMYLAMEYEGVGKSLDAGDSITLADQGFVDRQIGSVTQSGKRLVAIDSVAPSDASLFASSDSGSTWSPLPRSKGLNGVFLHYIAGTPEYEHRMLAASSNSLYVTLDGGLLWRTLPMRVVTLVTPPAPAHTTRSRTTTRTRVRKPYEVVRTVSPGAINGLFTFNLKVHEPSEASPGEKGHSAKSAASGESAVRASSETKHVIAVATEAGLFFTEDAGERWHRVDLGSSAPVQAVYASPSGDHLVVKTSEALLVSSDNASTWQSSALQIPMSDINEIAIADGNTPFLAATRTGLYLSADGGKTWSQSTDASQHSTITSVVYATSGQTAYVSEFGRVFQSDDAGSHWHSLDSSLTNLPIRRLWIAADASNRLYAITSGLGILFRE